MSAKSQVRESADQKMLFPGDGQDRTIAGKFSNPVKTGCRSGSGKKMEFYVLWRPYKM